MPLVLDPIQSGYNLSKINDNFQRIEDTWDEKLDRVNSGSFYNQMDQTLDMNSNEIINTKVTDDPTSLVTKEYVDALFKAIDGAEGIVPIVENRQQGDGVTTLFNSPATALAPNNSFFIQIDGLTQRPITDYAATGTGHILFTEAPPLFSDVDVTYFEPANIGDAVTLTQFPTLLSEQITDYTNLVFATVSDMVADTSLEVGDKVQTLKYNTDIVSNWNIVSSGAGDMTDGTLLLSNGLYASLLTRYQGNVLEYGAYGDNSTDDRVYFELARSATTSANVLTSTIYAPMVKDGYRLTTGLNLTLVDFKGDGIEKTKIFFDDTAANCMTSNGNTSISDINIDGGWDGATPSLAGDILSAFSTGGFTGRVNLTNVRLKNARRDAVVLSNLGYSQLYNVRSNASGRHGLHLDGLSFGNVTTVSTFGCVFSDCPFGYGVKQYDGHNITHIGLISEFTLGYELAGSQMRATSLQGYYNEFGAGTNYLTLSGSGIGLSVVGGFGGGKSIPSSTNYFFPNIKSNSNVTHGSLAGNDHINATGAETTISSTGVTESTLAQVTLQPGVYMMSFTVQAKDQGATELDSIWAQVTTSSGASGKNTATGTGFNQLSDGRICQTGETFVRLGQGQFKVVVSSAATYYLRCQTDVTTANVLLRGTIQVEPLQ